jgi:hypothetical protein
VDDEYFIITRSRTTSAPTFSPHPLTFSLECYTDLSSAFKAVVENAWVFSCIPPYVVMTKVVIKQKDSFIFYI